MDDSKLRQSLSEPLDVKMAVMSQDLLYLRTAVDKIDTKVSSGYVTKDEFTPIKNVVYGLIGLILIAVVGALVALVVK